MRKSEVASWFKSLQSSICEQLEAADGLAKFQEDIWERDGGGGGRTRVISNGNVIEKGGVNFSEVFGVTPANILEALKLEASNFFATGVSIVIHPISPMVPIIHMNVRYFEMDNGIWWFGGGIDLTPHYIDHGDAQYFHAALKDTCEKHHQEYYPRFKSWADDYFFIKHRNETRGIGGIFFDRLSEEGDLNFEDRFAFVKDVGSLFAPLYTHLMEKNKHKDYGEQEKKWQLLRRGRYVEFNLVLDKGTKFGLDTNGRTESILMSLPPQANWMYDYQPQTDSKEANTLAFLKKGVDWLELN
ncbi:oxygen-dependent coproporphyrinogen oxidase [Fulvivirgaceae bacterium BMA10]|uniref:coproporphyrinogen oxidase n=1 Tax=Splendidivirga corallicola TaxID=3051826 RepID=A0ABT8KJ21_9BACT|nr:oxygen-dependent coproporphyrinogen oxidase [Fulvivirgaceae bacterium BMA10]